MKRNDAALRDGDAITASEIASPTLWTLLRLEASKALELHRLSRFERRAHLLEYRVHHVATFPFAQADVVEQQVLELFLGERSLEYCAVLRHLYGGGIRPLGSVDGSRQTRAASIAGFHCDPLVRTRKRGGAL